MNLDSLYTHMTQCVVMGRLVIILLISQYIQSFASTCYK